MQGIEEIAGIFSITCRHPTPLIERQEGMLNKMPELIAMSVIVALPLPVFSWWNNRLHTLFLGLLYNIFSIIAPISQEIVRCQDCHPWHSLLTISIGTSCNNHSDQPTLGIHSQVYLGIEPPFGRLIS